MSRYLFTVGHSLRSPWEFMRLLRAHRITAVCDVRSTPFSPRNPDFNRVTLSKGLRTHHIAYIHMPELGARSTDPSVYHEGKVQYALLARTPLFQEGLERIRTGAEGYRIALLCAEKDPITCHRAILVTRCLRGDFDIAHILGPGEVESNETMERRLLQAVSVEVDMFSTSENLIEKAYDLQSQRIAYVAPPADSSRRAMKTGQG